MTIRGLIYVITVLISPCAYGQSTTFEIHAGDTINRINSVGFRVGIWRVYYPDSSIQKEMFYPITDSSTNPNCTWEKSYFPNGLMSGYARPDTTELWHENETLRFSRLQSYNNGDIITTTTEYYPSGAIIERKAVRAISQNNRVRDSITGLTPSFDTTMHERYFEGGQLEYLLSDTTKWWYENGALKKWRANDTTIMYDQQGRIYLTERTWYVTDSMIRPKLKHTITRIYYPDGNIRKLILVRGEFDGQVVNPVKRYEWEWDKNGGLIGKPSLWEGPIPK